MDNSNGIGEAGGRRGTGGMMDNVSLEDTVISFSRSIQDSTMTQLLDASETDFGGSTILDANVEEFLRSQFSASVSENENQGDSVNSNANSTNNLDVEEWLNKAEEDGEKAAAPGEQLTDDGDDEETTEGVEKVAAALSDAIINDKFKPEAWVETNDHDRLVPCGDWKTNIIQEIAQRQPLALMNMINVCCSTSNSPQRYRFTEILAFASANMRDVFGKSQPRGALSIDKQKEITFLDLRLSNDAEYYSSIKFRFRKVPKCKQPIVRTVEKFVTKSINDAFESNHAVLFTGYALIPKVVEDCNNRRKLNLSAEQKAKIVLLLQQAAYQEMVDRCLNFLAHLGYEFRVEKLQFTEEDKENQVSCDREPICLSSSQGSQAESMSSTSSQQSSMSSNSCSVPESSSSLNNNDEQLDSPRQGPEIDEALRNSPGMEFLRADMNQNSPGGSMGSYGSANSYSLYPPTIPDRDESPIFFEPVDVDDNDLSGPIQNTNVYLLDLILPPEDNHSPVSPTSNNSIGSEAGSHDEGPQRRRRRLN